MKTVRVVAAVIREKDKILQPPEVTENSKDNGNFLVEKLNREKHHRKH